MNNLIEFLRNLGIARVSAIALMGVIVIGILIVMIAFGGQQQMVPIYSNLSTTDANRIADQLAQQNIPFRLNGEGTQVNVPQDQVAALRLQFAEQGIGGELPGNELLDRDQSLGQSSRMQELTRLRALEGELSRTIAAIDTVSGARVHVVMPRRELFNRDSHDATASVVLKMKGATRLGRSQVSAIQHLVATAVPQLRPERISIVDDRGTLLAAGAEEEGDSLGAADASEMRTSYEGRLAERLTQLLEQVVGFGKARVQVQAEMDFTQTVVNEEQFNPEQQVLRSNETIEETGNFVEGGEDPITVGNNLPDATGAPDGGSQSQENTSRLEERSNFEIGKTLVNKVIPPGKVQGLSVAVLVDGTYTTAEDGTRQYQPRPAAQMEQLESLVRSAVGFTDGVDRLELVNMQFAEPEGLVSLEPQTTLDKILFNAKDLLQPIAIIIGCLLVALLVVRPLMTKILEIRHTEMESEQEMQHQHAMLTDQSGGMAGEMGALALAEGDEDNEGMIDIAHIEGRVKQSSLRKITEIVDKHPEEAVSILRTWMYQESS